MARLSTSRNRTARAALRQAAAGRGAGVVVAAMTTVLRRTSALS